MTSFALIPDAFSHVLAEFESLDPLLSALRLDSQRLKCTCISVSRKWLALGSSGGGLNLIQKEGWKQRLILAHKEGAISRVACCLHDEDFVAVATSQGYVVVWELNQERRGKPERIYVSSEHKGRNVTALTWDTSALRVFVGDHVGKVSAIKISSAKQGKAAATLLMFPVQIIATFDSRVVQLDYLDGRLLISTLTRSYLCDTEREKFWKIGNKERDGDYGACFFPAMRSSASQQPLIYCARPGSRMWEVNFDGEVQSTHQFKQLLSSPPLPVINLRSDPQYAATSSSPQSLAFPKLLFLNDHCVMSWTEHGIYFFMPQSVQVLLWSEVKDIQDISVFKNELFCLHFDGRVSHFSLLQVERCIDRLLKRGFWSIAARVCCLFQNSIISCKARKVIPIDRLENLKTQLDPSAQSDIISQLEEMISKLEPFDSACSSRRSSISSHESYNVLDSGIYRVISRRCSQSDEDSGSVHSQTMSDDERLKDASLHNEEDQAELDNISHASVRMDADRSETLLPFSIPLPFRSTSPRVSLQAVKESVSSFVRKTTEKIGTFHINSDARPRQDLKDEEQSTDTTVTTSENPEEAEYEADLHVEISDEDRLQELNDITTKSITSLQDPAALFDAETAKKILQEWLPNLENMFSLKETSVISHSPHFSEDQTALLFHDKNGITLEGNEPVEIRDEVDTQGNDKKVLPSGDGRVEESPPATFRTHPPCFIPTRIHKGLTELTTLCLELGVFVHMNERTGGIIEQASESASLCHLTCQFIRDYFFLLDLKRVKQCILFNYHSSPSVWETFIQGLKEMTESSPVTMAMGNGDLLLILKLLSDLEPLDTLLLLAHATRMYEKFGEAAVPYFIRFYPSVLPSDVEQICQGHPDHFLSYLDSLVKSKPEDDRSSLIMTLLQPESIKLEWLLLALSHDAPQRKNTMDAAGNPRPRSHLVTWGYGQLITLLIKLPADFVAKEKMCNICKTHGFWSGYLYLCSEMDRRTEAFKQIIHLDDISLLDRKNGLMPENLEEWKFILCRVQSTCTGLPYQGNTVGNGSSDLGNSFTTQNVAVLLAKVIGPDNALPLLEECGFTEELSERLIQIFEILRVAEKRQRAMIQCMLEKCERFLWS
ncbi:BLOC-2 complex member HPS5 isoform X2 [Ambystoma mexicanum]|uniref:BLOC-2 complex member HPS5 isoform X2 n=1 Tax=Ambystoma mexicanum TaxID=8296 RepID=UPI0037E91837